jgi:hypothetical protein
MKFIDELYKFFKVKNIDDTKEIMYYSTDKNSFIKTRIPKNVKVVTKRRNSGTYIDYDISDYYKNKHTSNDSYFLDYPKTILNYKKKLQETGLILKNNENIINELDSDDIIDDIIDNTINPDNIIEYDDTINPDNIINDYFKIDNVDSSDYIDSSFDFSDIIDEYQDNNDYSISNETYFKIEESKRAEMSTFYNKLKQNDSDKTWSIYSNIN